MENNQKIADKKKAEYQEGLEKNCADSAERSHDSYMKDQEKSCARKLYEGAGKGRADSAVRSHESYMKDPEETC